MAQMTMMRVYCVSLVIGATFLLSAWQSRLRRRCVDVVSYVLDFYLSWLYPIRSIDDGRLIPSRPYRWPNGQGNVAKFLEGESNSRTWEAELGPVYRIWSGMTPEVVLTTPEDVQLLFSDSDRHVKAVNNNSGWLMGELLGRCLGLISGDRHRVLKGCIADFFTSKSAASYIPRMEVITRNYLNEREQHFGSEPQLLEPVADLKFLPFWIIADVIYGDLTVGMREHLQELVELRETLWKHAIQGGASRYSWSRFSRSKTIRALNRFQKEWKAFNEDVCKAYRARGDHAMILDMYGHVERKAIDEEELLQTLDEMLFANLDVTMGGLSWNLLFLAKHQDVQQDIRREVRAANDADGEQHARSSYLMSGSTLLASSLLEASRLKPLAAFTVPQSCPIDRVVQGFYVPAKMNIIIDTHALNIRHACWGPDNEAYRPSRFQGSQQARTKLRYHFWRFGFGPRQCLGRFVADVMLRLVTAQLLERYELASAECTHWDKNPVSWILHPDTRIVCRAM